MTTGLLELICTYFCKIAVHVIFHICSIWLRWRIVLCIINVNLLTLDYQLQVSMNIVIPCKLHARFMVPLSGMSDRNFYRVEAENNLIIWISVVYFCLQGSKICVCLVRNIYQSSGEYVWLSTSSYHWQFVDCWWNNVELFLTKPHMDVRSARHHTRSQTIVCSFLLHVYQWFILVLYISTPLLYVYFFDSRVLHLFAIPLWSNCSPEQTLPDMLSGFQHSLSGTGCQNSPHQWLVFRAIGCHTVKPGMVSHADTGLRKLSWKLTVKTSVVVLFQVLS